jgi:NAD-dependent dihydropyrimidine dehydrogenase PreA subunit
MCAICELRGEGQKWYLNPKNYARTMYKRRKPGQRPQTESAAGTGDVLMEAIDAKCDGDLPRYQQLVAEVDEGYQKHGSTCQVLPLEDCYEVLEIASPLAAMACICRKKVRGLEEDESNYSCLGIGTGMFKWERWPERYRGGVKFLSKAEAREWLKKWNDAGMVQMIMNYGGQIGGICNCDYPDCMIIRHSLDYGIKNALFKAEYVAKVDYDECTGCGKCVQRCQFGAIKFEVTTDKSNIDQYRCYGCGVCATGCPVEAIRMLDRTTIPALREVW